MEWSLFKTEDYNKVKKLEQVLQLTLREGDWKLIEWESRCAFDSHEERWPATGSHELTRESAGLESQRERPFLKIKKRFSRKQKPGLVVRSSFYFSNPQFV